LNWELINEPQLIAGRGPRGLCISVRAEGGRSRELILEYPFPNKSNSMGLLQVPQRLKFSPKTIEAGICKAIAAGWDPSSRGRAFVFRFLNFQTDLPTYSRGAAAY
jgi:hypothetical protein